MDGRRIGGTDADVPKGERGTVGSRQIEGVNGGMRIFRRRRGHLGTYYMKKGLNECDKELN